MSKQVQLKDAKQQKSQIAMAFTEEKKGEALKTSGEGTSCGDLETVETLESAIC